jgi:hypothetical protein
MTCVLPVMSEPMHEPLLAYFSFVLTFNQYEIFDRSRIEEVRRRFAWLGYGFTKCVMGSMTRRKTYPTLGKPIIFYPIFLISCSIRYKRVSRSFFKREAKSIHQILDPHRHDVKDFIKYVLQEA